MCQDQHTFSLLYSHINYKRMAVFRFVLGYQHMFSFLHSHINYRKMAAFHQSLLFWKLCLEQKTRSLAIEMSKDFIRSMSMGRDIPKNHLNIKFVSGLLSFCYPEQLSVCPRFIMIETKNNSARLGIAVYFFDINMPDLIC